MILYLNIDTVSKYHLVIIYFTLMTLMFDSVVILQGEIRCLSLSGVKWSKELKELEKIRQYLSREDSTQ